MFKKNKLILHIKLKIINQLFEGGEGRRIICFGLGLRNM
jgi:hypothetical protein